MNLKPLALLGLGSLFLTACSTAPQLSTTKATQQVVKPVEPIVFTEPTVSPAFYALNPLDYNAPPEFEVNLANSLKAPVNMLKVNDPNQQNAESIILDKNRFIIPLTDSRTNSLHFAVLAQDNELDVTDIDDFLNILEGKARHYPVHFASSRERNGATDKLKSLMVTLDQYALNPKASYDILLRAAKASSMARNMDMGEQNGPKALSYAKRLLAMQPKDPNTNLWLGFGLSEGGAFKEAMPYLQTAMNANVQEAYLSMANNFLYLEQKRNAVTTLKNYKVKFPQESAVADQLISEIEAGTRYNVWQAKK